MENDETMFDEIVRTEIKPDGTVEASLVENAAQEMEASVAEMAKGVERFQGRKWRSVPDRGVEHTTGGKPWCIWLSPKTT